MTQQTAPAEGIESPPTHKYLKPSEVGELLRLSPAAVYRLASDPSFPVARIGRSWRIRADALDRWLASRTQRSRG
jgi:excisionase family DNA binding protein